MQENQDAVIGRAVRTCKEELTRLASLRSEAREMGEKLSDLGNALQECPESVTLDGRDFKPVIPESQQIDFPSGLINAEKIEKLCSGIRASSKRHIKLEMEKKDLGIE